MADNDTLSPAQRRTITALLTERDTRSAAAASNLSERTVWRWLAEPAFRVELTRCEGELINQAARRLVGLQDSAIAVFETILTSSTANDANRLRAAQAVLDYLLKLRELHSMEERLSRLEEAANGKYH